MGKLDTIYDRIIYDSPEYEAHTGKFEKRADEKILSALRGVKGVDTERIRDELCGIMLDSEREMFIIGFKYGTELPPSDYTDCNKNLSVL